MATTTTTPPTIEDRRPAPRAEMLHPDIETMPRSEIHALQSEKLRRQVHYVYDNARFFRERWDAAGVHPRDIKSVDDLWKLPTFDKEALRADRDRTGDPFAGTRCLPRAELAFVTHSSGTSGKPNFFGMTPDELTEVGRMFARSVYAIGMRPGDETVMPSSARWHGTMIAWEEAFQQLHIVKYMLGKSPLPHDLVSDLFEMAPDMRQLTSTFVYHPEAELEYMRTNDLDPKETFPNLKLLWSAVDASPMRRKILLDTWGVPLKNQYGSGDQIWMSGECPHNERYTHAPEDYFIFEVLDPLTGEPVPPGGTGVLHITNLWMRSFPYIRYSMEDMVTYETAPCTCGRTSLRLSIRGRFAWSVRIGEDYIFSQEVENVLWAQPNMAGSTYQLVRRREQPQDALIVRVVPNPAADSPTLKEELEAALTRELHVPSEVIFAAPGEIGLKGVKMQRVIEM